MPARRITRQACWRQQQQPAQTPTHDGQRQTVHPVGGTPRGTRGTSSVSNAVLVRCMQLLAGSWHKHK